MTFDEACQLARSVDGLSPMLFADSVARYEFASPDWYITVRITGAKFPQQIKNGIELGELARKMNAAYSKSVAADEPSRPNGFLFQV